MSQASEVPRIFFAHLKPQSRLGWQGRGIALLIALAGLAPLLVGTRLNPNPRGIETHTQLGLPPCSSIVQWGLPCPSCGMTTAVTQLSHGHPIVSFITQPMGMLIGLGMAMCVVAGLYVALTGRPSERLWARFPGAKVVIWICAGFVIAWGYKIIAYRMGIA